MSTDKQKPPTEADDLASRAAEHMLGPNPFIGLRGGDVIASGRQLVGNALKNPALLLEQEAQMARELIAILVGNSELAPEPTDKRYADPAWKSNRFYRMALQGHLAWSKALGGLVDRMPLDKQSKERASFVVSLVTGAFSPNNTLIGNPAALKRLLDTGGMSAVHGLRQMLVDLFANRAMPSQTDMKAFEVGKVSRPRRARSCFATRCSSSCNTRRRPKRCMPGRC